jgi:uncharacterized membrane protein YkvA (DUF1232 family)
MEWWQILLLVIAGTLLLLAIASFILLKMASAKTKELAGRIRRLPPRDQMRLVAGLAGDERIPTGIRLIPPRLVLYLAMPIDLVPDFVPVLGQLDDILVAVIAIGLGFASHRCSSSSRTSHYWRSRRACNEIEPRRALVSAA